MTPSELLIQHLSDKVNRPGSKSHHNYNAVYDQILAAHKESATCVLELGVLNGCSLRAWRDYFPNAEILGVDNDPNRLIREERIRSFLCDTTHRDKFLNFIKTLPEIDFICDDASHLLTEQLFALAALWPKLKRGGIYVVEDIVSRDYLELFKCFPNAKLYDLRIPDGVADDMMAVMTK